MEDGDVINTRVVALVSDLPVPVYITLHYLTRLCSIKSYDWLMHITARGHVLTVEHRPGHHRASAARS